MTLGLTIELPQILQSYHPQIEATIKPFIRIITKPHQPLNYWQSKFGGVPYFPKANLYPVDQHGAPLHLLAQLNFAEMPHIAHFPEKGILQFYIAADDDLYGLDFDDQFSQDKFRVIYFDTVIENESELLSDFSFLGNNQDGLTPITGEYGLQFELAYAPVSVGDTNFSLLIGREAYDPSEDNEAFYDAYAEHFSEVGHKLGGYPFFTQSDPREYDDELKSFILLFQMDTDHTEGVDIMWGDSGVANFFIHPDALKRQDFSKVLYNWDCY